LREGREKKRRAQKEKGGVKKERQKGNGQREWKGRGDEASELKFLAPSLDTIYVCDREIRPSCWSFKF